MSYLHSSELRHKSITLRFEEAHSRNVNDILPFEVESSCVIPLSDSTVVHRIALPECVNNKPKCLIDQLHVLVAQCFKQGASPA